jgi:hypothetical protein
LLRRSEDQGVPERNAVKAVQIDGPENVGDFWKCDVKLGDQFDFPTGDAWVKVQFAGDRDEILLEHLQGHNSGPGAAMFCDEIEGASLLGRSGLVVRVDENVGVEQEIKRRIEELRAKHPGIRWEPWTPDRLDQQKVDKKVPATTVTDDDPSAPNDSPEKSSNELLAAISRAISTVLRRWSPAP